MFENLLVIMFNNAELSTYVVRVGVADNAVWPLPVHSFKKIFMYWFIRDVCSFNMFGNVMDCCLNFKR